MNQNLKNKIQLANVMSMIGGELSEKASAPRGSKYAAEDSLYEARDTILSQAENIRNEVRNEQVRQYYNQQMRYNNPSTATPVYAQQSLHQQPREYHIEENGPVQMELPLFEGEKENITINTDKLESLVKENTEIVNKINKLITSVLIEMNNNISENNELLKQVIILMNSIVHKDSGATPDISNEDISNEDISEWDYEGSEDVVIDKEDNNEKEG